MNDAAVETPAPKWQPLGHIERRVLGVMVEKAKTTPESYPMTLNAIRVGANQKSNRFPQMNLDADAVEEALDRLRSYEAATEIVGDGRTSKYRHRAYDWMGVDKVELAVMAELLLRGAQTVGELRGRAARMEPISDLAALQPILQSLQAKKLLVYLTPPGRGAVVTHNLYQPNELERLRREHGTSGAADSAIHAVRDLADSPPQAAPAVAAPSTAAAAAPSGNGAQVDALREELRALRSQVDDLQQQWEEERDRLQRGLDDVRQQLGI